MGGLYLGKGFRPLRNDRFLELGCGHWQAGWSLHGQERKAAHETEVKGKDGHIHRAGQVHKHRRGILLVNLTSTFPLIKDFTLALKISTQSVCSRYKFHQSQTQKRFSCNRISFIYQYLIST